MCYDLLGEKFGRKIKVREIIACTNSLPFEEGKKRFVKVVHIRELVSYITWFKEKVLDDNTVFEIVEYLGGYVNI